MNSKITHLCRSITSVFLLAVTGCATIQSPHHDHLSSGNASLETCAHWFVTLDEIVSREGVTDIGSRRVVGFPYLRINRFLASMKDAASNDQQVYSAWIDQMRALDADGRRVEIANLSAMAVDEIAVGSRDNIVMRVHDCAEILHAADAASPIAVAELYRRAFVPDDYSTLNRALGLYALSQVPFYLGVQDWQDSVSQTFTAAREGTPPAYPVLRYLPPPLPGYTRTEVGEIMARMNKHPLGLTNLTDRQRDRLFATFAPVLEVETSGDFDRIGRLFWGLDATPQVDVSRPVVYRRLGFIRVENKTLLQLVYTAWMPERPRTGNSDLFGGHLDGVVWRVTLAPDGEPVLFDSIHPCGCYHMFFPTPRLQPLPAPQSMLEWSFTPASLPSVSEGERLKVSVQAQTHYLRNVSFVKSAEGKAYQFAEYDELRTLPLPDGGTRSIFGPDGLIEGTERGERYLFWPMGVASAGAMRQAGTQATAFVGRRHFDDADIFEKRFRLRY